MLFIALPLLYFRYNRHLKLFFALGFDSYRLFISGYVSWIDINRRATKIYFLGKCPAVEGGMMGTCQHECTTEYDCKSGQLCCKNGCGTVCRAPEGMFNIMFILGSIHYLRATPARILIVSTFLNDPLFRSWNFQGPPIKNRSKTSLYIVYMHIKFFLPRHLRWIVPRPHCFA